MRRHLLAHLVCPGRHTVSGLITVLGGQFTDWTADYSLYSRDRVDADAIFNEVRRQVDELGAPARPLCVALDDTILRKVGKCIPGAAYRRDPLGPAFHLNLVWAQRRLQISAAAADGQGEVRMVPVCFEEASTPRKPRKGSDAEALETYKEQMKQRNLNAVAIRTLEGLQKRRAQDNEGVAPALHVVVDGSYTNRKTLRHLPEKTTLIGRIRKDAKLSARPAYLICTDPDMSLEDILQEYIWRWDIEVNHRDEKTLLGVGEAQVRNENSVRNIPATAVAALAMLHLAAINTYGQGGQPAAIPPAKWRNPSRKKRPSTQDLINELRRELWSKAIRPEVLTDFMNRTKGNTTSPKYQPDLCSSLFAATA